jgi:hypothetical protein
VLIETIYPWVALYVLKFSRRKKKIVTYNLHYGGKKDDVNYWERILDKFSPDLVLAQESFNPQSCFPPDQFSLKAQSAIWAPVPAKWGSAILATRHKLTPIIVPGFAGNKGVASTH